jgi:hypothetical protein
MNMSHDSDYETAGTVPVGVHHRICPTCNRRFKTDHPRQVHCSPACKRKHRRIAGAMRYADELTDRGRNDPAE